MDMQDVDFEMKYEPGKDEADPLDFLSRHPLPVVGNNDTEKILKASIETEHALVLDRIREETQDRALQKLSQTIRKGNWETSKKDADLAPFYRLRTKFTKHKVWYSEWKELFYQWSYSRKSSNQPTSWDIWEQPRRNRCLGLSIGSLA